MHADSLREILARCTPRTPGVVYLADGTTFRLEHADYFRLARGGRTLIVWPKIDEEVWIDTALIARADVPREAS